ncbi:neuropeptide F receptor-like protein [Leptotrombidium deliense]|uniref:Neuropeptide F receptor-like protein n=1 Tax=Leptotrombidium deliense TaxID=299467 RepID=A0A443SCX9_9ACAR|nr:neuropeptide F receptor-like protein [Leptotrombidium deliense]
MPFTLVSLLRRSWTLGKFLCKLVPFLQGMTVFVSAATVTAIAIDRLIRVFQNEPNLTYSSAGKLSCCYSLLIWIIAGVLSFPVFLHKQLMIVGIANIFSYPVCLEMWPANIRFMYTMTTFIVAFIIPLFCLVVCHLKIKQYLSSRLSRQKPAVSSTDEDTSHNARTISYTICWLPWNVYNLYLDYFASEITLTMKEMYLIFSICHVIAMSSTISNAIVYGFMNTNIKKELKILKNVCCEYFSVCFFKSNQRNVV